MGYMLEEYVFRGQPEQSVLRQGLTAIGKDRSLVASAVSYFRMLNLNVGGLVPRATRGVSSLHALLDWNGNYGTLFHLGSSLEASVERPNDDGDLILDSRKISSFEKNYLAPLLTHVSSLPGQSRLADRINGILAYDIRLNDLFVWDMFCN